MSDGGDATRWGNRSGDGDLGERSELGIGGEFLGEEKGNGEGRRCGVGDTGDDARRRLCGVVIMGEGYGLSSNSACASSSYRRVGGASQFSLFAGGAESIIIPSVRGQLLHASRPCFALRTVVARGSRHRAIVAVKENLQETQALRRSVLRAPLPGVRVVPRVQ